MAARRAKRTGSVRGGADLGVSLHDVLVNPAYCGLEASPLQEALCLAADGHEVSGTLARDHFGVDVVPAFGGPRRDVCVVAGVRGGKSLIASAATICAALRCDLSPLQPFEIPRGAIVSATLDNAVATYRLLLGICTTSPVLHNLIVGEPKSDSLVLRRPHDGREVELCCVAASAGGAHLRSRWLVSVVLDEVALFGDEASGSVVNADEVYRAGRTRLLPGGWAWLVSSPFGPSGLLHSVWRAHYGKQDATLVCHAPTRALNPTFPQADIDAIAALQPDVARREYYAAWTDPDAALIPSVVLEAATRAGAPVLERAPGASYVATIDPATRGNAWTLTIGHRQLGPRGPALVVDLARQWVGSSAAPLDAERVVAEQAALLAMYGVQTVHSDAWAADPLSALYRQRGVSLVAWPTTAAEQLTRYEAFRVELGLGLVELPPDPVVRADLLSIRRRATSRGVSIVLPRTPDGRHCDYAPALALLHERASTAPVFQPAGASAIVSAVDAEERALLDAWRARRAPRLADRIGRRPGALDRFRLPNRHRNGC